MSSMITFYMEEKIEDLTHATCDQQLLLAHQDTTSRDMLLLINHIEALEEEKERLQETLRNIFV